MGRPNGKRRPAGEASGALGFGADRGASRYDGRAWQTLRRADGLPDQNVYAIVAGPDGAVWLGTRGGVARAVAR